MSIPETYIILNPTAGDGQAQKRWEKFEAELQQTLISYKVVTTREKNHAAKLANEALASGERRIAVFSGDGTLNEVLQGFYAYSDPIPADLKLLFFPAGSSCDFEKKFDDARNWIDRIHGVDSFPIDLFKVECRNTSGDKVQRYILNNSSMGIISSANEKFNSVSGVTKKIKQFSVDAGAVICGLQAIKDFKPFTADLMIDNEPLPSVNLSNVTVFKTSNFGGDMSFGVKTLPDDGILSLAWLDGMSRMGLTSAMPSLFTGKILEKPYAHYKTCNAFQLTTEDNIIVETDGENIGIPPVKYSILPKALEVIV
ncbi:MAG: diacylglycerol kinase family protein [Candidatus Marinimicrobia bacterium]|nr:diacylglycerol kinase family protein [Candidatus Neomarinimicrobiota bacterium]